MRNFLIPMLLLLFTTAHSQKQDNIWYFGYNAGLDFNSGMPLPLLDNMISTDEGVSTISDANGNLLFYTNGVVVYNKDHQIMQNGIGLLGDSSSAQSALIIQKPGSTDHYYIFTTDSRYSFFSPPQSGVNYSEVDMTLNNGLGAIIKKNLSVIPSTTEHLTATYHHNGKDIWVVAHGYGNNIFHAVLVTENGVTNSVTSAVGASGPSIWPNDHGIGMMKISSQGNALAMSYSNFGVLEGEQAFVGLQLCTFDNKQGIVSNAKILSYDIMQYGVEFSPSGNLLYSTSNSTGELKQYNLTAQDVVASAAFINNDIGNSEVVGSLQMAVDGKLYCTSPSNNTLSVINNPDSIGGNCGFAPNSVSLGSGISYIGLPFRMAVTPPEIFTEKICIAQHASFSIKWSTDAMSINWDFGDGNTSDEIIPAHVYNEPGTYIVTATVVGQGRTWVVTKEITIPPMMALIFSEICEDDVHMLRVGSQDSPFDLATSTVAWSGPDGFTTDTAMIATPSIGNYTVVVTPDVGCPATATYYVNSISCFIPKGISPNDDGYNDSLDLTEYKVVHLAIFNRYGVLVYDANNYTSQWRGQTSHNQELPTGTYYYLAELPSGKRKSGWIYINR